MSIHRHVDLIIIGGGCAGLSLALSLSKLGKKSPKVLIIEQRLKYVNDRTWCFWDTGNPEHKSLAQHAWTKFEIRNQKNVQTHCCDANQYLMLPSDVFYQHALSSIASNPNIELITGQEMLADPVKQENNWHVQTLTLDCTSKLVVDTRPMKNIADAHATLWQSFVGYEIEVDFPQFSPDKCVLMDFDDSFNSGTAFIYFLPTSSKKALIEYTVFSEKMISHKALIPLLEQHLQQYTAGKPHQVLRVEHGILPMGNQELTQPADETYIYAGLFAGAARPSSGYAFQRIQAWAKVCSETIVHDSKLYKLKKDRWMQRFMDELFLRVIKTNLKTSAFIFAELFKNCDVTTAVKFLSDRANMVDYFHIIKSMPQRPFIKALPHFLLEKILLKIK